MDNQVFDTPQVEIADKDKKEKHRRAVAAVRDFMQRSSEYRKPHIELAKQSRSTYENWSKQASSIIHRANLKLPYGFSVIEDQVPKLVQGLMQERPLIQFEGETKDAMEWEDSLTDYHDQQLEKMDVIAQLPASMKSLLLDGTLIAKVPYQFKEDVLTWDEVIIRGSEVTTQEVEEYIVKHDGPAYELIPFIDFFPDWRVKESGSIKKMRGCVHRTWKSFFELEGNPQYSNLDELEMSAMVRGSQPGSAWKAPYYSEEAQKDWDKAQDNKAGVKNQKEIELWEFWGLFDVSGKGEFEEYLITIANGDVVIRCQKNPFKHKMKPFVAAPNIPRDGEFYGIPELLAVRSLIKEADQLRNARLDQTNMAVNRMFLVDRNSGIKARQLYSRPNGIIWTNDVMTGLRELPPPEVPQSVVQEGREIQSDIQNALGMTTATPQLPQMARTFGRSATGVEFINSVTASRASLKLFLLSEYFLKPMYEIMAKMNNQYISKDQFVRTQDPNEAEKNPFTELPTDAFASLNKYRLVSAIDTGGNENVFNKLQAVATILQTAEATQPGVVNWEVFFEGVMRSVLGKHYKKFIRSDAERMLLQQQQMAMEQAANVNAGKRAPQPNAKPGR